MTLLWVDEQAPPHEALTGIAWRHVPTLADAQAVLAGADDVQAAIVHLGLAEGVAAIRQLRGAAPLASLIALSADEQRGTVMGAISAGAAGFILKTLPPAALLTALRLVRDGGIPLPVSLLERRAPDRPGYGTWTPAPRGPEALGYAPEEAAVLRRLIQGLTEPLIVQATGLAEATVKTHLAAIHRRLNAGARPQVVLEAARLGLRFGPVQDAAGARASSIASP